MTINLITLATVKTQLGIAVADYDIALTALIPIVSADVRWIMNSQYSVYAPASITSGDTEFTATIDFEMGDVIYSDVIAADSYIDGYSETLGHYTSSGTPSDDGTYIIKTINIRQWPAISKMIEYRRIKQTQDSASEKEISSKAYGGVSLSYATSEVNSKYNYPQKILNDLGPPFVRAS